MVIERIDPEKCTGCGICIDTCSADVIRLDETNKKAIIKYAEDCRICALCELFCPNHAVYVSPSKKIIPLSSW
jgi:NAD-dependent dihydropyrimidine dehydrogenase PreA subunit